MRHPGAEPRDEVKKGEAEARDEAEGPPETRSWREKKCLVFDDSFEHEVWASSTGIRTVLIVDIAHPDLSAAEKRALQQIMRLSSRPSLQEGTLGCVWSLMLFSAIWSPENRLSHLGRNTATYR